MSAVTRMTKDTVTEVLFDGMARPSLRLVMQTLIATRTAGI